MPVPRLRLRRRPPPGGSGVGSPLQIGVWTEWDRLGVFGGEEEEGGVRSGPGAARTILLFHIISSSPSKQPRMVGGTIGVYSVGLIFVSARTNKRHHHHHPPGALERSLDVTMYCTCSCRNNVTYSTLSQNSESDTCWMRAHMPIACWRGARVT
jgi:hypothetical protein